MSQDELRRDEETSEEALEDEAAESPDDQAEAEDPEAEDPEAEDPEAEDPEAEDPEAEDGEQDDADHDDAGDDADDGEAQTVAEWLGGKVLPKTAHRFLGLGVPAMIALVTMWRLEPHTVDDAYITYRYARNFARGLGLVYNAGERIEGYTNFLWTVLLGVGVKLGFEPNHMAKWLGGAAALASLYLVFQLTQRLRPLSVVPCVATWLLASSSVFMGYAVFGLETIFFTFLILAGYWLMQREEDRAAHGPEPKSMLGRVPWSGLVFAAAGLTRPEAPMYVGIFMLFLEGKRLLPIGARIGKSDDTGLDLERDRTPLLFGLITVMAAIAAGYLSLRHPDGPWKWPAVIGILVALLATLTMVPRSLFGVRNLLRGGLFVAPVAAHLLWRKSYYGSWLPNTLKAKTGDRLQQFSGGLDYVFKFLEHEGVVMLLVLFALGAGLVWRHREVMAMATLCVLCGLYVLLVGGDWMPLYRYLAPVQPFLLLLVGLGARTVVEQRSRVINYGILMLALISVGERSSKLNKDRALIIRKEKLFWDTAAGGVSQWFASQEQQRGRDAVYGAIALGDIGEIGYKTDMPILDLLGLVDPVISDLPGGYTNKVGPGFRDRFFDYAPRYFILISSNNDCVHPSVTGSRVLFNDRRFRTAYGLSGKVALEGGFYWCIYENRSKLDPAREQSPGTIERRSPPLKLDRRSPARPMRR